jgi:hypothetical protein
MRIRAGSAIAILSALTTTLPVWAADVPVSWDGATANWTDSLHWGLQPPLYPTNTSPLTYAVNISAGTLSLNVSPTINSLTFTGGNLLASTGYLTVLNSLVLQGDGTARLLTANLSTAAGTTATLSGPGTFTLGTLTLGGTLTAAGGTLSGGRLVNNGLITVDTGAAGTVSIGAAGSLTTLINNGSIAINSGMLIVRGPDGSVFDAYHAARFSIAPGAALTLNAGMNVSEAGTIAGAGDFTLGSDPGTNPEIFLKGTYAVTGVTTVTRGLLDLVQTSDVAFTTLNLRGFISLPYANATIAGLFTWNDGILKSSNQVTASGGIVLDSIIDPLNLETTTLINAAGHTATFAQTNHATVLQINDHATFTNAGNMTFYGGLIDASRFIGGGDSGGSFLNTGTLTINAPSAAVYFADALEGDGALSFINQGLINLYAGDLYLAAADNGATTGALHLAAGTTLHIGGSFTFAAQSSISGDGNVDISKGSRAAVPNSPLNGVPLPPFTGIFVVVNGAYTVTGSTSISDIDIAFNADTAFPALSLTSSFLSGTAALTVAGNFSWVGTKISVPSILASGNVTLDAPAFGASGTSSLNATAFTLASTGTFTLGSTNLVLNSHSTFTNNGTFTATKNTMITGMGGSVSNPFGRFINNGTLTILSGLTTSSVIALDNAGTIHYKGGRSNIAVVGNDSPSAILDVDAAATVTLSARTLAYGQLNNHGSLLVFPRTGSATIGGAGMAFTNSGTTTVSAGLLVIGDTPATASLRVSPDTAPSTFINTGTLEITAATVLLAAAQDPATTGLFTVNADATLELAADYSFALFTDPTLTGAGLVIIDPNVTLTLAMDTAFTGTIEVNGTLIIAPPRDPNAAPESLMQFTILPQSVPEPASLALLTLGTLFLVRRPRKQTAAAS